MLSIECLHEIQNKYDIYAVFKGKSSQMDVWFPMEKHTNNLKRPQQSQLSELSYFSIRSSEYHDVF